MATVLETRVIRKSQVNLRSAKIVREFEEKEKSQGKVKAFQKLSEHKTFRLNPMISVSTKMPYQEVRETSLSSGKSQGR